MNALRVVEQAIGEPMDGTALEDPNAGKNQAAVALGKLGGKKGGKARAEKLSPDCWRDAQCLMDSAEIVIGKVQCNGMTVVLHLL